MSHLESLERKLREMSENGNSAFSDAAGESNSSAINMGEIRDGPADLKTPRKFIHVMGYDGRHNDIVYCQPLCYNPDEEEISVDTDASTASDETRQKVMVYFGGDMQDFPEMMEQHKEHRNYMCWNLESTANVLQKQFPNHHIVVVRPSRIQIMTFSCFDNFVNSTSNTGVPDHVITHGSLQHLELLLKSLSDRVEKSQIQDKILAKHIAQVSKDEGESEVSSTTVDEGAHSNGETTHEEPESEKPANPHLDRGKISIVGFSKGCVVLNQLLYEFHYLKTLTPDDISMNPFLSSIEDMYWLDGGHNGGKNTWITSRSLIETLCRLNIRIHVHMTPYQLTDERRPWIRKEERIFSETLQKFNAPIRRYVSFENEPPSLQQHFRLVGEFGNVERTMEPEQQRGENNSHLGSESSYSGCVLTM